MSIFNFNVHVISDMILEIITHPQNMQVTFGSRVTLICTTSLSSNVTFSWTHNGTTKMQSTVNGDTSRLTISNVRYSDGGSYVCIVRSGSLTVTSNTATITILYGKLNCSFVIIISSAMY